jgi:hypothetical protein
MASASVEDYRITLCERRIDVVLLGYKTGSWWDDSDDGAIDSVEDDGLAKNTRTASEAISPQTPADNGHRRSPLPIFLRREFAAENQVYAQSAEEP